MGGRINFGRVRGWRWAFAPAVLAVCLLWLGAAHTQAAIYVGSEGKILRSSLDGSVQEPDFVRPGGWSICGIAASPTHLFWSDSYGDTIGMADLGGVGVKSDFLRLSANSIPCELAADSEFVYWVSKGADAIGRARIDGSQVQPSFIPTTYPCSVAVSETAIYWGSEADDTIWRTDIDGVNGPELVLDNVLDPCGLALTDSHLFWVEREAGTIGRASLDGSEALSGFIIGASIPTSLRIHGGHLYWLNAGGSDRSIGRADLAGGNVNQAFIAGLGWAYGLAVDNAPVIPPAPVQPLSPSSLKLGKLRRLRNGSVLMPVSMSAGGWLRADVPGARVTVGPSRAEGRVTLGAGRVWLRVAPKLKRGDGSRCVLRAFRRGLKVKLRVRLTFAEDGKEFSERHRSFRLFKPAAVKRRAQSQRKVRTVDCFARKRSRSAILGR